MRFCLVFALLCAPRLAWADVTLLVGEPYGHYGAFNPTGHAAVYLSRVCADSPTVLRRCAPGETGVVLQRYGRIGGHDWFAVPLTGFLYAVDREEDVPVSATRDEVAALRDRYRRAHLRDIAPDRTDGRLPDGDWFEATGAAYDRRIEGFTVATSPEADDRLIRELNARPNRRRFNLLFRNCADFAKEVLNTYFPGAVHANRLVDFGITTPKQVARSLVAFGARHPGTEVTAFAVPQIPGSRPPTHAPKHVLQMLVTSKKYLLTMALLPTLVAR